MSCGSLQKGNESNGCGPDNSLQSNTPLQLTNTSTVVGALNSGRAETMQLFALASLVALGVGVHVALFGWRRAPAYRVNLTASQKWWVGALFVAPILLGALIVIWRDEMERYFGNALPADVALYLIGFVMAVVFGIAPTSPEGDEPESHDRSV